MGGRRRRLSMPGLQLDDVALWVCNIAPGDLSVVGCSQSDDVTDGTTALAQNLVARVYDAGYFECDVPKPGLVDLCRPTLNSWRVREDLESGTSLALTRQPEVNPVKRCSRDTSARLKGRS